MSDHTNIYFFNAQEALKTALEQNPVPTDNPVIDGLQVCYYNAEAPLENTPENCIWVPLENVYNYFVTTKNRFPLNLSFLNTEYSMEEQNELTSAFNGILQAAMQERETLTKLHLNEIRQYQPDFNEKPWRVFVPACRETTVMQYVSKNIAKAFKELGYEVKFFIQDNAMQPCNDTLPLVHTLHEFKPHITVNINHLVNQFLHADVFNIVWFQDQMPVLTQPGELLLRERDYIYCLNEEIEKLLINKGIESTQQKFCIDNSVFYDKQEPREKKIVFVGSSLKMFMDNYENKHRTIYHYLKHLFKTNPTAITHETIKKLSQDYEVHEKYILMYIYTAVVRETAVEYICQQDKIPVEIYGRDWEYNHIVAPHFKHELSHGKEVNDVYNSAKYILAGVHPYEMYLQRFPEAAASGGIPLIYDGTHFTNKPFAYPENCLLFNTKQELETSLTKDRESDDLTQIIEDMSFTTFAKHIIGNIERDLK